jgi:hypothetical protein
MQFHYPQVDLKLKKHDLLSPVKKAAKSAKDKIISSLPNITQRSKEEYMNENIKNEQRADFEKLYENTFNVIEKTERLAFLEESVPRRLINVGLGFGMCTISFMTCIAIPLLVTPVAPVVAGVAATALGVVSAVVTVTSLGNSLHLLAKEFMGDRKLSTAQQKVTRGITPNREHDEDELKEQQSELRETEEKKQKKAPEKKSWGSRVYAFFSTQAQEADQEIPTNFTESPLYRGNVEEKQNPLQADVPPTSAPEERKDKMH